MTQLHRRRFLTIAAASAAVAGTRSAHASTWRGRALGAHVSMQLDGLDASEAAPVFAAVEAELRRLEDIFSLYRTESQISRLNRTGLLVTPAPELLQVLGVSSALHIASGGAFDPTIQPLWLAVANGASKAERDAAKSVVGWNNVSFDPEAVRLAPGAALTLNGIAQGAVTDAVVALLRARGLENCLVDMGEVASIGGRSDGEPWSTGIRSHAGGGIAKRLTLRDRALATSSPRAMILDDAQSIGHILHPQGAASTADTVAVSAPTALIADGASTALCLMPSQDTENFGRHFADLKVELIT